MKKAHPVQKTFCCSTCNKAFELEMALHHHEERCGKDRPKPFKCANCGKTFSRKATLQHHQQHAHQLGGSISSEEKKDTKRKTEEEEQTLPKKIKGAPEPDKVVSAMKGAKVDSFFYPKTETQKVDQQIFFKESLQRLEAHLKKALEEKKAIKWNLVYKCQMSMLDSLVPSRPRRYRM